MGFGDFLTQTFPGVRVTSSKRDPNSRLGRANPKSYHNVGMAWDVAPVEGMTFDQFRDRIGQDYDVKEAIDEVKNPSRNATGPHWHVAVGDRKERQPVANGLAGLMQQPMASQVEQPGVMTPGLAALLEQQLQQGVMPGDTPGFPQAIEGLPGLEGGPRGGGGNRLLGAIGDAMQVFGGGQATYAPMMENRRQEEMAAQQAMAQRQQQAEAAKAARVQQLQDWMFQQGWKQANPDPTSMERDLQAWNDMSPQQRAQYAEMQDVRSPIAVSGPTGTYRVGRMVGQPQQGGGLRSEAEQAIANGADPAAVWARYREMGGE